MISANTAVHEIDSSISAAWGYLKRAYTGAKNSRVAGAVVNSSAGIGESVKRNASAVYRDVMARSGSNTSKLLTMAGAGSAAGAVGGAISGGRDHRMGGAFKGALLGGALGAGATTYKGIYGTFRGGAEFGTSRVGRSAMQSAWGRTASVRSAISDTWKDMSAAGAAAKSGV